MKKSFNDFLALLQEVLPKATQDTHLASAIYQEMVKAIQIQQNLASFEKFCEKSALPDAEPKTVQELEKDLTAQFGEEATIAVTPDDTGAAIAVEIELPERTVSAKVKVDPVLAAKEEEVKAPYVPFPVALPDDPELIWVLGRREDLGPDEAERVLARIQEEFWETKKGLQLQRDRVEKSFAEFISQVPATPLNEAGLRRHYKEPESLKILRPVQLVEVNKDKTMDDLASGVVDLVSIFGRPDRQTTAN